MANDPTLWRLITAIASGGDDALDLLSPATALAALDQGAERATAGAFYFASLNHYVYAGDTALHVAAAAHRADIAACLIALGADVAAVNRRHATPLHYAADGVPGSPQWDPAGQAATIACLIAAGADPNAADQNGATPLHRAVRTRCADATRALLDGGADVRRQNTSGSTPGKLAAIPTGRGSSGSLQAKVEQARIIQLLEARDAL